MSRHILRCLAAIGSFLLGLTLPVSAASGDLDTSFDGDGKVTQPINSVGNTLAVQLDGKILAAGLWSPTSDFLLVRYSTNGAPDTSFGGGDGIVTMDVQSGSSDSINDLAVQPDGRIVACGTAYYSNANHAVVARYESNGDPDTSFGGGDGWVALDAGTAETRAEAVVLQPDGKIVIAGRLLSTGEDFLIARFATNGVQDTTFAGGAGFATVDILNSNKSDAAYDVALQSDGKIIVAGRSRANDPNDFALARFTTNGILDTTFGGGLGSLTTDFPGDDSYDYCWGVKVQSDDRIVAVGAGETVSSAVNFAVVRYTANGGLDTTFGGGTGKVLTSFGGGDSGAEATDVVIQSDGKIVVCGSVSGSIVGNDFDIGLAKYNPNGTLDTTFGGGDGLVTTDFPGDVEYGAVALDPNGKIVVGGGYYNILTDESGVAVARYLNDVSIPTVLKITGLQIAGGNVTVSWQAGGGKTNQLQVSNVGTGASFTTNFTDLGPPVIIAGSGTVTTNQIHTGGATNAARYYRVRQL